MMNRLWVRLSFTYGAVILIAFLTISLISVQLIRANAEQAAADREEILMDGMVARLASDYAVQGSWEGVDQLFIAAQGDTSPERQTLMVLKSPDGSVIYPRQVALNGEPPTVAGSTQALPAVPLERLPADEARLDTLPVVVGGEAVAYLSVARPIPGAMLFPAWGFARDIGIESLLILTAITIGVISVLFGVIISRWLTNPLDHLTVMTNDIGKGRLDRRVRAMGTAETISLARSFNGMVDQLQDAEQKRRSLVADVAHELRTPVAVLQSGLYAIIDDAYPMTKSEIAGLYEQTRMLSRLVEDLHELSQADANQLPLNCQPLDLTGAIEDFAAPFRIVAESENVAFDLAVEPNLPLLSVDQNRVNQVLHNLLTNALRHTPEGGAITLDVRRAGQGDCIEIAVTDTGSGIKPEHLPHVFERFYRGDYGRSRDQGGTGLGLAIARAIAEAHHGTLDVASEGIPGKGATFTLRLPATTPVPSAA